LQTLKLLYTVCRFRPMLHKGFRVAGYLPRSVIAPFGNTSACDASRSIAGGSKTKTFLANVGPIQDRPKNVFLKISPRLWRCHCIPPASECRCGIVPEPRLIRILRNPRQRLIARNRAIKNCLYKNLLRNRIVADLALSNDSYAIS
jgi:hypothetical protein